MRLPYYAWNKTLTKLGLRWVRTQKRRPEPIPTRRPWMEPLERREMMVIDISYVGLLNDTGMSSSDLLTDDPQLSAAVTGDPDGGQAVIEFDVDADDTADTAVNAEPDEPVTYDPTDDDSGLATFNGSVSIGCFS